MPGKVDQLKEVFLIEATRNNALPNGAGLFIPVFHPQLRVQPSRTERTFPGDFVRMPELPGYRLSTPSVPGRRSATFVTRTADAVSGFGQ